MFIPASNVKVKPYIAFAFIEGQPDTLVTSAHVSRRAAKVGMAKLAANLTGPIKSYGWKLVEAGDREHGIVV